MKQNYGFCRLDKVMKSRLVTFITLCVSEIYLHIVIFFTMLAVTTLILQCGQQNPVPEARRQCMSNRPVLRVERTGPKKVAKSRKLQLSAIPEETVSQNFCSKSRRQMEVQGLPTYFCKLAVKSQAIWTFIIQVTFGSFGGNLGLREGTCFLFPLALS